MRLTSTSPQKIERMTCEATAPIGSGGSKLGGGSGGGVRGAIGVVEALREENREEKKPVFVGTLAARLSGRDGGFFSDPPV